MSILYQQTLTATGHATGIVKAYGLVDFDDATIVAADQPVKGFALSPAKAGQDYTIVLIGTCEAKASGAIAKGDKLVTALDGTVKVAPAMAANVFGKALTSAADGEWFRYVIS